MKKITILSAMIVMLCSYVTKATVRTVSNNAVTAGQYTNVDSAINASSVNDTVYVNGSPIDYGTVIINKRITLIGAGYAVTGTSFNVNTIMDVIDIDSTAITTNPVNGAQIIGISLTNSITAMFAVGNIHIARCAVPTITTDGGIGWIVENNVITNELNLSQSSSTLSSFMVRNNFFASGARIYGYSNYTTLIASGLIIDHNIMEGQIQYISYATITNNIFFYADISASTANTNNNYNNNVTVYGTADALPFGSNTGNNNQTNVAPALLFSNGLSAATAYPALVTYNWQVNSSSNAHNGGTDGTDIGMYGGTTHPMPNLTGASTLPQMTLLNISNSSIPLNGTLNYEFKARIQN